MKCSMADQIREENNNRDIGKKTAKALVFKFFESSIAKAISFIVSIVLARILAPNDFGIISLCLIVINFCDVFVTYGFGNSLVVFKDSDETDFSTCFFFGLLLSIAVYFLTFFLAPLISVFYGYELLTPLIRIMALRIPLAAIISIQQAYVAKKLEFKKYFIGTLIGSIVSAICSITAACMGFGVWALAIQVLSLSIVTTISLWLLVKWRPHFVFSLKRLKRIYSYGWKILLTGLIDTGYNQLRSLVIAKEYSSEDLAYYDKGMSFSTLAMSVMDPTINGAVFPALSKCNDDKEKVKEISRGVISIGVFIVFPIMIGLVVVAKPLVLLLLGEKWMDCVIFLQIGCLAYFFRPIQIVSNCIVQASKKGGLFLALDILKKGIGIALLVVFFKYGVYWIALSLLFTNIISTIIGLFPNKHLIGYSFKEQFFDIVPSLLIAVFMGVSVYFLNYLPISNWLILVLQVFAGMTIYLTLSFVFKLKGLSISLSYIKRIIGRNDAK